MRRKANDGTREFVTVLFSDIVGSTGHAIERGDAGWTRVLQAHDRIIRKSLRRHGGREVDTAGDGFFATFARPSDAVECGLEIVEDVRTIGLEIRVGVHTGEVTRFGARVGGIAVHVGARVMSFGTGQVIASATVRDLMAGSDLDFEDLGPQELKGLDGPLRLFAVHRRTVTPEEATQFSEPVEEQRRSRFATRRAAWVGLAIVAVAVGGVVTDAVFAHTHASEPPGRPSPPLVSVPPASVVEIDPITMDPRVVRRDIPGVSFETQMQAGEGGVWITTSAGVLHVDPESGQVGPISLHPSPVSVPSLAVALHMVWISHDSKLSTIDPATDEILRTRQIPAAASTRSDVGTFVGMMSVPAVARNSLWFPATRSLIRIMPNGTRAIPTPIRSLDELTYGSGYLWALDVLDDSVFRIDPRTLMISSPIALPPHVHIAPFSGPGAGGGYLWAIDIDSGYMYAIDVETLSVERLIRLPGGHIQPQANAAFGAAELPTFAVAPTGVWVSRVNRSDLDVVSRIDSRSLTVTSSIRFDRPAISISADPTTGKVFVLFAD
jgi:class 3 adenylate cyclase